MVEHASAIFSTVFRLAAYIFLRLVPTRMGSQILISTFLMYLASWFVSPRPNRHKTRETCFGTLCSVLFSLPSSSRRIQWSTFAINALILFCAADFIFSPSLDPANDVIFTRVGAVYPDAVKIVIRYPQINSTEEKLQVAWREVTDAVPTNSTNTKAWRDGPVLTLTPEDDWVGSVKIRGLWPSTAYEYMLLSSNHSILPYPSNPIQFRTFPDPRLPIGRRFRFTVSSAISPSFPYSPLHRRIMGGFDSFAHYALSLPSPKIEQFPPPASPLQFAILVGNPPHNDLPVYVSEFKEACRRLYRRMYGSSSFRKIYEHLPIFHAYVDYEVSRHSDNDANNRTTNRLDAFKLYNGNANYDTRHSGQNHYNFRYGDAAFFVMDTSLFPSSASNDSHESRTLLGNMQLAALYGWLSEVNNTSTFKFIVTPAPFTSLWRNEADTKTWAGFADEKATLLDAFQTIPNIVLISGDGPELATVQYNTPEQQNAIWEFTRNPRSLRYLPFQRTLHMTSAEAVRKATFGVEEAGETETLVPREQVIKHIANGSFKWLMVDVDTTDLNHPTVSLEIVVDGSPAHHFRIDGTPVKLISPTALANFLPGSLKFKDMLNKFGIKSNRWF